MLHTKKTSGFRLQLMRTIECVLLHMLPYLNRAVAVGTNRVDFDLAIVCIHEEGLSDHLQVGQGRNE